MALAVEHDLTVDRTDLASILARLSESAGDPGESIRRLEGAVAAWTSAPDLALLRAMYILASVHYRQADHPAALAAFERTVAEARRAGLEWSVYGLDARAMAVTTAYEMGEWDHALEVADHAADVADPGLGGGEHRRGRRCAARGTGAASAAELLAATRPWWAEEGRTAVQSGRRRPRRARPRRRRRPDARPCTTRSSTFLRGLWGEGRVAAEVRLAAVAWATSPPRCDRRAGPVATTSWPRSTGSAPQAAEVWGEGSLLHPPLLEGRAWQARARAEHAAGPVGRPATTSPSTALVARVARGRRPVRAARRPLRGGAWPVAPRRGARSRPATERGRRAAPRPATRRRRSAPSPSSRRWSTWRRGRRARPATLTAREAEVLALVAEGRSNGEIGRALFISTKTASVHVSNILAKLGAASRGEAVAVARTAGLLDTERREPTGAVAEPSPSRAQREDAVGQATTSRLAPSMCAMTSASGRSVKYCT